MTGDDINRALYWSRVEVSFVTHCHTVWGMDTMAVKLRLCKLHKTKATCGSRSHFSTLTNLVKYCHTVWEMDSVATEITFV